MSTAIYFRSLAARCLTSARHCSCRASPDRRAGLRESADNRLGVIWLQQPAKCGQCVDVRPNWKEQPVMPTKLRYD